MKIAITGGKGGTGKSTVSTALANELVRKHKVLLIDADVDCPDDHILLDIERKKEKDVFQIIPKFDFDKCIKCGKCSEVCKFNAIAFVKDKYPIFNDCPCNGCKACIIACPVKAISEGEKQAGEIYSGKKGNISFVSAQIMPNYAISAKVVGAELEFAKKLEEDNDFVLIDTAAGTHCSVVEAVMNADLALAVTEPTPLGEHDLGLILKLLKKLNVPAKVVLNKADVGDKKLIQKIVKKYDSKIVAEIPYSKEILKSYSKGQAIKDANIKNILKLIEK